ncbi:MAG: hypothetical protein AAGD10_15895 [Myxococcota bacterium]
MSIPVNHIILIPLVLGIGFWFGFRLGAESARKAAEKQARHQTE